MKQIYKNCGKGIIFSILFVLLLLPFTVMATKDLPDYVGDIYVQDFVGILSDESYAEMSEVGNKLELATKAQVVVAIVPSIEEDLQMYATDLFRYWGIGDKEQDNGVLLLVVPADRNVRIEVGYGLEGRINDALAGQILDERFIPYAKENKMEQAILSTYGTLVGQVLKEYGLTPADIDGEAIIEDIEERSWFEDDEMVELIFMIVFMAVFVGAAFLFGGSSGGSSGGGSYDSDRWSGGSSGGGSWGGGGGSSGGGGASRSW